MTTRSVLFVDDENEVLDGLRRGMHGAVKDWRLDFCLSAHRAMIALAEHPFDAIVVDLSMPFMDGARLLRDVREKFPKVSRLVLTGASAREALPKVREVAHRFLTKPCEPEAIIRAIEELAAGGPKTVDPFEAGAPRAAASASDLGTILTELERDLSREHERLRFELELGANSRRVKVPPQIRQSLRQIASNLTKALAAKGATSMVIDIAASVSGNRTEIRFAAPSVAFEGLHVAGASGELALSDASPLWIAVAHAAIVGQTGGEMRVESTDRGENVLVVRFVSG